MVVLGGMRSFLGPALGALFSSCFPRDSSDLHRELAVLVRPVFVASSCFRRSGLIGVGEPVDRTIPQEDNRRCRDVGAPDRSAAAA